jgi:hypothetical protein
VRSCPVSRCLGAQEPNGWDLGVTEPTGAHPGSCFARTASAWAPPAGVPRKRSAAAGAGWCGTRRGSPAGRRSAVPPGPAPALEVEPHGLWVPPGRIKDVSVPPQPSRSADGGGAVRVGAGSRPRDLARPATPASQDFGTDAASGRFLNPLLVPGLWPAEAPSVLAEPGHRASGRLSGTTLPGVCGSAVGFSRPIPRGAPSHFREPPLRRLYRPCFGWVEHQHALRVRRR